MSSSAKETSLWIRLGWMAVIWVASIAVVGAFAWIIRLLLAA